MKENAEIIITEAPTITDMDALCRSSMITLRMKTLVVEKRLK